MAMGATSNEMTTETDPRTPRLDQTYPNHRRSRQTDGCEKNAWHGDVDIYIGSIFDALRTPAAKKKYYAQNNAPLRLFDVATLVYSVGAYI